MAERAKCDDIDKRKLTQIATHTLGSRRTAFFMSHSEFAIKSANLACQLFDSRNDSDYVCFVPCEEKIKQSETIWAATLLSHLCQSADLTYDDVCDLTNVSVANYLHWILPDKTISLLEGTQKVLSQLGQVNHYYECGPIFAVLAKALTAVAEIGEDPTAIGLLDKRVLSAFSTQLWSHSVIVRQMDWANVSNWSPFTKHCIDYAKNILDVWDANGVCPMIQFRSGEKAHNVDWHLDMSITPPPKDKREFIEIS